MIFLNFLSDVSDFKDPEQPGVTTNQQTYQQVQSSGKGIYLRAIFGQCYLHIKVKIFYDQRPITDHSLCSGNLVDKTVRIIICSIKACVPGPRSMPRNV